MIVTSLIDEKKYFWVKVPRTATHSYEKLFFPELHSDDKYVFHLHAPFSDFKLAACKNKPNIEGGFSLIRHPIDKFISGLKYLKMKREDVPPTTINVSVCEFCGEIIEMKNDERFKTSYEENLKFVDFLKDENTFYDFMYSYFDKNCNPKYSYTLEDIFQTENVSFVKSMFVTQTKFAYHPKVKIFQYENLKEFNSWIESTLGYSTSNLGKINSSKNVTLNIDVTTQKFKDLVKYLFNDDFKIFGYTI